MAPVKDSIVPKVPDLLGAAIRAYRLLGTSAVNDEADDKVADLISLSDKAREELHGTGPATEFNYRMAWVRTWLKNAGFLENVGRSLWSLTREGRDLTDQELIKIVKIVRDRHSQLDSRRLKKEEPSVSAKTNNLEDYEEDWKQILLQHLLEMEPAAFERLCRQMLLQRGFTKVEVTGQSGDGGIDGMGILRVNLLSFQVIFQAKRWRGSVGASVVRDFRGAMIGRADKGLVITTGNFTASARQEATRDGAPAIDLVDGDDLCELLKELRLGVVVEMVESVSVDERRLAEI